MEVYKSVNVAAVENADKRLAEPRDFVVNAISDYENGLTTGFKDGAQFVYGDLLKWNNPEDNMPDDDVEVLCIIHRKFQTYAVVRHDSNGWWQPLQPQPGVSLGGWIALEKEPIAWRYINEVEKKYK